MEPETNLSCAEKKHFLNFVKLMKSWLFSVEIYYKGKMSKPQIRRKIK